MNLTKEMIDDVLLFRMLGRLDGLTVSDAETQVKAWLAEGPAKIIGDLSGLEYISSAGLRLMLVIAKAARTAGGGLCLFGLQETVNSVFDIAGFQDFIPITDSRDQALTIISSQ